MRKVILNISLQGNNLTLVSSVAAGPRPPIPGNVPEDGGHDVIFSVKDECVPGLPDVPKNGKHDVDPN